MQDGAAPEPGLLLTTPAASGAASLLAEIDGTNRTDLWRLVGVGVVASLLLATWTTDWSEALVEAAAIVARDVKVATVAPAEQIISVAPAAELSAENWPAQIVVQAEVLKPLRAVSPAPGQDTASTMQLMSASP